MCDNPSDRFMKVANHEQLGKLVKTWATGKDYVANGRAYPVPTTFEELKQQLTDAQVGATLPATVTGFSLVFHDEATLVLRIPSKALIERMEQNEAAGKQPYLPGFYDDAFRDPVRKEVSSPKVFNAQRIGDYTISNCA